MRLPLFQRILLWFVLNLVILAVIFFGYVNLRVHLPADSVLAGALGERLQVLPHAIGKQLSDNPREDWQKLLEAQARDLGVDIFLLTPRGHLLAGSREQLPRAVQEKAAAYIAKHRADMGAGPDGPPPPLDREPRPMPPPEHHAALAGLTAPFFLQTDAPARYWAGLPILILARGAQRPLHGILVVSSDSITGHGLFFDPIPWLASIAAALVISVLWWWPLIRGITRPLGRVTAATEKIAGGHFEVRLPDKRRDEIGRLSRAVNQMAVRLKALVWGHKQFLGSVAHELTSPVAHIKLGLGILERDLPEEHRQRVRTIMEDAEHMSGLLEELLSFSRAELNPAKANLGDVALMPLAQRAAEREARPGAEIIIQVPEGLSAYADPDLVTRALGNLVRNAVRHAGKAGPIRIEAVLQDDMVRLVVADSGPGVPEEDLPRIFEPFHQTEAGRTAGTGVGLGLYIVKTCVDACRGTVFCRNRPEGGFEVVILLKPGRGEAA